jgi:hypothetical protein
MDMKNTLHWLHVLPVIVCLSCGQNKNVSETMADSLQTVDTVQHEQDSMIVKEATRDPNVYEIPADHPWLVKFIWQPFPWDSCGCCRASTIEAMFPRAAVEKEKTQFHLFTTYSIKDSYFRVAEMSHEEMQDCTDNTCEVVLDADLIPLDLGMRIGMSKADFLHAIGLDKDLPQNIYSYVYKTVEDRVITVRFEFKNNRMALFSYGLTPCGPGMRTVPTDPFFTRFFNKPFRTTNPDSVQKMITAKVKIRVERNYEADTVDRLSESDMYPQFLFDSSSISFRKWPQWEIVSADLKSPNFSFINGIRVGMTREDFLYSMGVEQFEGDEFTKGYPSCMNVIFNNGVITEIKYSNAACN